MSTRMNWEKLLSTKRVSNIGICAVEKEKESQFEEPRSEFERDLDQIIFSYPFRRLQDKTQVIPFPEYDFVHTRLTHSLEVASVGRSFGKLVADLIFPEIEDFCKKQGISKSDIGALLSAACYAHDIGNPPFGHSGESSISYYFENTDKFKPNEMFADSYRIIDELIELEYGSGERGLFTEKVSVQEYAERMKMWSDLSKYEGNANGFRIITQNCERGIDPTVALLGTFTKYPRESFLIEQKRTGKSQSKYGFFYCQRELFKLVADELGLISTSSSKYDISYCRHPLAFLMEASDDIAYGIIDFEDGCKLGLIDFEKEYGFINVKSKFKNIYEKQLIGTTPEKILISIAEKDTSYDRQKVENAKNFNEKISYLRSIVIKVLINECFKVFKDNYEAIMCGEYDNSLIDDIDSSIINSLSLMKLLVRKYVYNYPPVLQCEASGFEVIYELIDSLAVSSGLCYTCGDFEDAKQLKLGSLLPEEYLIDEEKDGELSYADSYTRVMRVLDYISGMTDAYAISLFRKIKGISIK